MTSVSGDGTYVANGGNGDHVTSGGGGGGIVSLVYTSSGGDVNYGRFFASPGVGKVTGGPGLVYLESNSELSKPDFLPLVVDPLLAQLPSYKFKQIVVRGISFCIVVKHCAVTSKLQAN